MSFTVIFVFSSPFHVILWADFSKHLLFMLAPFEALFYVKHWTTFIFNVLIFRVGSKALVHAGLVNCSIFESANFNVLISLNGRCRRLKPHAFRGCEDATQLQEFTLEVECAYKLEIGGSNGCSSQWTRGMLTVPPHITVSIVSKRVKQCQLL